MEHKEIYTQIGQRLRQVRRSRDEKMETVENATGISTAAISRIENGHYEGLTIKALVKLATYYDITCGIILEQNIKL